MLNSLVKGVNLKNYGSCKHVKNVIGNGGEVKQLEGVRVEIDKEPWLKKSNSLLALYTFFDKRFFLSNPTSVVERKT